MRRLSPVRLAYLALLGACVTATEVSLQSLPGSTGAALASPRVPWIESRAPFAFSAADRAPTASARSAYRVDAEIMLPLGIGSIKIATRQNVGSGAIEVRDYRSSTGETIRAYEFIAYSLPERAQNVDRSGFFWEAHSASTAEAWAAYLGAMTFSRARATAVEEARQGANRYEVIDGLTTERDAVAALYRVRAGPRRTTASEFYADLRPLLQTALPRRNNRHQAREPLPTRAFLATVDATLRAAAQHSRVPVRERFVYNAQPRWLELTSIDLDRSYAEALAESGTVRRGARVYELNYETGAERANAATAFRIWIEAPASGAPTNPATVVMPVAFEYRPRAFLRLRFVRVG